MKPLLSIAIATKNREQYCIAAIESILNFKDERVEIAIADNSASTQVKEFVENLNSAQIKYLYDTSEISSIDNFNRAVNLTTGDYISLLGDDDTILPEMITAALWMKANDVDTITPLKYLTYFWPGSRPQSPNGTLYIPEDKPRLQQVDPYNELTKLVNNGLINYHDFKIAKSYHGIVKKELMEVVKQKTGNYYGALSPDIFSVVALSYLSKKHYFATFPLSIAGICRSSTSSNQIYGEHVGELKNMPHLKNRPEYTWDNMVPKYYCVTNTWAESGVNALKAINAKDILKKFNVYPVVSIGILMNHKYILKMSIDKSEELRKERKQSLITFWMMVSLYMFRQIMLKVKSVLSSKFGRKEPMFNDLPHIAAALNKYHEYNKYSEEINKLLKVK